MLDFRKASTQPTAPGTRRAGTDVRQRSESRRGDFGGQGFAESQCPRPAVYHITPANQATTLPNIHQNSLAMEEIQNALNAGKEVITHTDAVSVPGWTGAGYILFDPQTGDGAFKIGGGTNGGWAAAGFMTGFAFGVVISGMLELKTPAFGFAYFTGYLLILTFLASYFATSLFIAIISDPNFTKDDLACFIGGFLTGLCIGLTGTNKVPSLASVILSLIGWYVPSNPLPQCVSK
jgi:hypothetical protein